MKLLVLNKPGLKLPEQAHPGEDACWDAIATTPPQIVGDFIERPMDGLKLYRRVQYIQYGTNLHVCPVSERSITPYMEFENLDAFGKRTTDGWTNVVTDFHIEMRPRSSVSKYDLSLCNPVATVDAGYRDQIFVRFKYVWQPQDFIVLPEAGGTRIYGVVNIENIYAEGEKIIQIKPTPNVPMRFEMVDQLPPSSRGPRGFGSSGK